MLEESLTALAASGGAAIVAAMATDAWASTRAAVVRLFRRAGEGQQTTVRLCLEDDASLVAGASDAVQARQALLAAWQLRLETLVSQYPDAADELRALISASLAALPQHERHWVQNNIARDHGQVFAALGGNVIVHASPPPPPPPAPEPPDAPATDR
ncbi:hypothetical protein ABZ464_33830 [Streptomyces sp. NPDC005820]|uniref:hypothetical protein n=1 Tax=Streptomyces sp. NPDC005820 TaxID=3157069 RepID=UPI0033C5626B